MRDDTAVAAEDVRDGAAADVRFRFAVVAVELLALLPPDRLRLTLVSFDDGGDGGGSYESSDSLIDYAAEVSCVCFPYSRTLRVVRRR